MDSGSVLFTSVVGVHRDVATDGWSIDGTLCGKRVPVGDATDDTKVKVLGQMDSAGVDIASWNVGGG